MTVVNDAQPMLLLPSGFVYCSKSSGSEQLTNAGLKVGGLPNPKLYERLKTSMSALDI